MEDIPSEQLLGHLPEQACEEGCLKGRPDLNFFVGDDFVNQKTHPERKEEGNEIFQDESNDRTQIQKRAKTVALDQSNHGGEHHTDEEKSPCQKDHEKIDGLSAKDASTLLNLKDNVQGSSQ